MCNSLAHVAELKTGGESCYACLLLQPLVHCHYKYIGLDTVRHKCCSYSIPRHKLPKSKYENSS